MHTLNSTVSSETQLVAGAVGAVAILVTTAVYYATSSKDKGRDFPKLRGVQLYHAWNFFQRRYNFLQSNFERNLGKSFSFNVLHHNVVALAGEDARQAFFSNPHLSFYEGYKILLGAVRISLLATNRSIDFYGPRCHRSAMWTWRRRKASKGTLPSSIKS